MGLFVLNVVVNLTPRVQEVKALNLAPDCLLTVLIDTPHVFPQSVEKSAGLVSVCVCVCVGIKVRQHRRLFVAG
jgi:uncharacterized membrane protein